MDTTYIAHTSSADFVVTAAIISTALFVLFILSLISYAIVAFLLSRIFKKAGLQQWEAWVPVYNTWKFLEIGGQHGIWAVLSFVPLLGLVALVFMLMAAHTIGKRLGKENWFIIITIFLPIIWLIWLAFDDSKWQKHPTKKS